MTHYTAYVESSAGPSEFQESVNKVIAEARADGASIAHISHSISATNLGIWRSCLITFTKKEPFHETP